MKDINFFEQSKKALTPKTVNKPVMVGLIILGVCVAMVLGVYGYLLAQSSSTGAAILSAQGAIADMQAQHPNLIDIDAKKAQLDGVQRYSGIVQAFDAAAADFPVLDAAFYKSIAGKLPEDVSIADLKYNEGILTLRCRSQSMLSPPLFADALKTLDALDSVLYTGYQVVVSSEQDAQAENGEEDAQAENADASALQVEFSLTCVLKGRNDQ